MPEDKAKYEEARKSLIDNGSWTGELTTVNCEGHEVTVESRWTLVRGEAGNPESVFIIDTDITEKKQLEFQYLRSQRMDTIGTLAGGIAHDLNNALAPVLMGADMLRTCEDQESRQQYLDIISSGANRATALVKQILSFARGSGGRSGPIKLGDIIGEMESMIRETFPKSISISFTVAAGEDLWTVQGEATEIHQVLLNLCVNARDAMPNGGHLLLSAQNVTVAKGASAANQVSGPHVMISVADTGSGIRAEILPHIFEPFFTTKIGDKGTGLGLPTIAGIVKHHGGFIEVNTEPGNGTEFKIYLPATASADTAMAVPPRVAQPMGHGELILLIDDEEAVRELTKTMLETYGYRVVTAQNGFQGIDRFKQYKNDIRLLVTDTDMPYVDGMGAIRAIRKLNPEIPVIIASGSDRDTEHLRRIDIGHLKTLAKPYGLDQLLIAVGAV